MRDNNLNRDNLTGTDLDRRTGGMSSTMIAVIVSIAVLALLFLWAPWSGPTVATNTGPATNTAPATTTGSSTRPTTPAAPTTVPAPATPAAPSTTR